MTKRRQPFSNPDAATQKRRRELIHAVHTIRDVRCAYFMTSVGLMLDIEDLTASLSMYPHAKSLVDRVNLEANEARRALNAMNVTLIELSELYLAEY
jgi:hypothetical protein